jgi:hypothetical protein
MPKGMGRTDHRRDNMAGQLNGSVDYVGLDHVFMLTKDFDGRLRRCSGLIQKRPTVRMLLMEQQALDD